MKQRGTRVGLARALVDSARRSAMSRRQGAALEDDGPPSSARCAPAALDHSEVEDVPRPDGEEEEPPFTEDEVNQMMEEIRELAGQTYTNDEELNTFLSELDGELAENKDLQEQGHILLDVLEYLQNPDEEEGEEEEGEEEEGEEGGGGGLRRRGGDVPPEDEGEDEEPYPGEEGLQELWKELQEVCSDDDIAKLEEELEGKAPEEQWKVLTEVYDYLQEEQEK